jgi:hypothetical protein
MEKSRDTRLTRQISRWGPALLIMAVIFVASSIPRNEMPSFGLWDWVVKKGGHMLGYALLALAYLRGLTTNSGPRPTVRQMLLAVALAGLYALTDEFHQLFVPGRSAAALDVLIDTLGASLGVGVWEFGRRWVNK